MKNKIILALVTIIFISSCANKFSLTKRKYTKGYYFASSKNNNSSIKENTHKQVAVKNLPAKHVDVPTKPATINEIKNIPVEFVKIETTPKKTDLHKNTTTQLTASAKAKSNISVKSVIKPVTEKQVYNNTKKGESDANLVILIILCFLWFFNLIAIYIHDGKKFTLNFLITLLLDFTFIGGIIYSLLVVLDVVDLS